MATFVRLGSGNWRAQVRRKGWYIGETLLLLGMRTIASYVAYAAACGVLAFVVVRRVGIIKGPPSSN